MNVVLRVVMKKNRFIKRKLLTVTMLILSLLIICFGVSNSCSTGKEPSEADINAINSKLLKASLMYKDWNSATLDEKSVYQFFVVNEFSDNWDYYVNNYENYPDNYSDNTIINIPASIIEEYISNFFYIDSSHMRTLDYYNKETHTYTIYSDMGLGSIPVFYQLKEYIINDKEITIINDVWFGNEKPHTEIIKGYLEDGQVKILSNTIKNKRD